MIEEQKRPQVGVGVMILNDKNEVLLGLRKNAHGEGSWCFPGGHLEFGETIFETARRETKEECNLDVKKFEIVSVYDELDHIATHGKHLVNIGVQATYEGGEPKNNEPDKCEGWKWFSLDTLPENIFPASRKTLYNFKNKIIYSA